MTQAAPVEPPETAPAPRPVRLQQTVSLGYAGDGPLAQIEPCAPIAHGPR